MNERADERTVTEHMDLESSLTELTNSSLVTYCLDPTAALCISCTLLVITPLGGRGSERGSGGLYDSGISDLIQLVIRQVPTYLPT
jgi:hypothetical protein